jgi:hypothetical protein
MIAVATRDIRTVLVGVGAEQLSVSERYRGVLGTGLRPPLNALRARIDTFGLIPSANATVTNVPGPRVPLYYFGRAVGPKRVLIAGRARAGRRSRPPAQSCWRV